MRIIISPAKKMHVDTDSLAPEGLPQFLSEARRLLSALRAMPGPALQALWNCNDAIAALNMERLRHMDLERDLTPAILSYEGIQYQYMAPGVFETGQFAFIQEHLRILSGFYGLLRPFDGVVPYRLEMQAIGIYTRFGGTNWPWLLRGRRTGCSIWLPKNTAGPYRRICRGRCAWLTVCSEKPSMEKWWKKARFAKWPAVKWCVLLLNMQLCSRRG